MGYAYGEFTGGPWYPVDVKASSAQGKVLLSNPDGTVVSVQPEGHVEDRPAGTDGPYEQATISNGIALYGPYENGVVWPFGLRTL